jgi:integrase
VIRLFTESIGADLPVRSITQGHVRGFKTSLLTKPSEATGRPMSPATIQKLLSAIRAVLSWGRKQGFLTVNPAEDITQRTTKPQHEEDRKLPYTVEQAQSVLKAALRDETPTAYRWLWLIGFYSGARIDEIAGLRREDVRTVDGVLCFDIRPHEGRRLKNAASRRLVPVHPALIAAGFTADLRPFKSSGHYYSKRINPWMLKETSIADPRHTFKDRLRAARVPEPIQRTLMCGGGCEGSIRGRGHAMNRFSTIMRRPMHRACCTFVLSILLLLSACSVRYGPRVPGFQPGYEAERLGERTYHIQGE